MAKKKTWLEKFEEPRKPQIKKVEMKFADIPANSQMLIPTPKLIDEYIQQIGFGRKVEIKTMRKDLALMHRAEYTCPVTTGIFLRIVAEAGYEKWQLGHPLTSITPFWRVISPDSLLARKLSFGSQFIIDQRELEYD